MKTFKILYLSYAGRTVTTVIEAENEDDAVTKMYVEEGNYSSDCCHKVISVDQI
jgi:hypothetical protein